MAKVLISTIPNVDVTKPPGILSILASCCEQIDYDYEIFDLSLHMHKKIGLEQAKSIEVDFSMNEFSSITNKNLYIKCCEDFIKCIKKYSPDFVAISVFTFHSLLSAQTLLDLIQKTKFEKKFKIVLGGVGLTSSRLTKGISFGKYCLQNKLCDHIILGEGEKAFIELLKNNLQYPGIDYNPPLKIEDLDDIPTPSYKKINPRDYFYSEFPEITLTGSKGCVRKCSFCDVVSYWDKFVYRDGKNVANDLYTIYKNTGVQHFNFSDSLINGSMKSFRAFNKHIISLKSKDINFNPTYRGQFICRPQSQMNEQDYIDMKHAGCHTLVVGIESFSEKIRDHMGKKFDNKSIDFHVEMCAKYQLKTVFLLLSGYVTESIQEHYENLKALKKYQKYGLARVISAINIAVGGLSILPGSPLYNKAEELGIISSDNFQTYHVQNNPSLTDIERLRRSVEVTLTAAKLGYGVLHFPYKIQTLKKMFYHIKQKIQIDDQQMQLQNKDNQFAL